MKFQRANLKFFLSKKIFGLGEGGSLSPIKPGESKEIALKVLLENYYRYFVLDKSDDRDMKGYGIINSHQASSQGDGGEKGLLAIRFTESIGYQRGPGMTKRSSTHEAVPSGKLDGSKIGESDAISVGNDKPPFPDPDSKEKLPNIKVNLMLGNYLLETVEITKAKPGLSYQVLAKSDNYKLVITNQSRDKSLNLEDLIIEINYLTPFPLLTKTIPLKFFQNAFDSIWNDKKLRYVNFRVENEKLYLKYDPEFVEVYSGSKDRIFGQDLPIIDFDVKKIDFRFDMKSIRNKPTIVWTISFNQGKLKIDPPIVPTLLEIDISKFDIVFEYELYMRGSSSKFNVKCQFLDDIFAFLLQNKITSIANTFKSGVKSYIRIQKDKIYDSFNPIPDEVYKLLYYWIMGRYDITYVDDVRSDNKNMYISYVDYIIPNDGLVVKQPHPRNKVIRPNTEKVDHIVVVMMENRSYDQMLGFLSVNNDALRNVDGLTGAEFNEDTEHDGTKYGVYHITNTKILQGPAHETENIVYQMAIDKNGIPQMTNFINDYRRRLKEYFGNEYEIRKNLGQVMGYYNQDEVPVYDYLAREFAICTRWFCSHPGPTLTNRFITLTGDLLEQHNQIFDNHPSVKEFYPIQTKTIFDYLNDAKVSWNYFETQFCTFRLFGKYTFNDTNIQDIGNFYKMAKNGTLSQVTFIDPDYINLPPGNDDHPPADISRGQEFIRSIVAAIQDSPKFNKTLLIITYDENGGFYDHVPPPMAPSLSSGYGYYGPRVPTFVMSPYIPKSDNGRILAFPTIDPDNNAYDHTSIIATILRKFCAYDVPRLGHRTNQAKDVWDLLSLPIDSPRVVKKIPKNPSLPHPDPSREKYILDKIDDKDGFHHLMLTHGMLFRG